MNNSVLDFIYFVNILPYYLFLRKYHKHVCSVYLLGEEINKYYNDSGVSFFCSNKKINNYLCRFFGRFHRKGKFKINSTNHVSNKANLIEIYNNIFYIEVKNLKYKIQISKLEVNKTCFIQEIMSLKTNTIENYIVLLKNHCRVNKIKNNTFSLNPIPITKMFLPHKKNGSFHYSIFFPKENQKNIMGERKTKNKNKNKRYKTVRKKNKEKTFRMKEQKNNKKSKKNRKRKNIKKMKKEKTMKLEREVACKVELLRKLQLRNFCNNHDYQDVSYYSSLLCYRKNIENYVFDDSSSSDFNYKEKIYEIFYGNFLKIKKQFNKNLTLFNKTIYSPKIKKHYFYKRIKALSVKEFCLKNAVLFNNYYDKITKKSEVKTKKEKLNYEFKISPFLNKPNKVTHCVNGVNPLTVAI